MRELTIEEIEKLASRPNVKRISVENFLMSMGDDFYAAANNVMLDAHLYGWNKDTVQAIVDGILLAAGRIKNEEIGQ